MARPTNPLVSLIVLGVLALAVSGPVRAQTAPPDTAGTDPAADSAVRILDLEAAVEKDPTNGDAWTRLGILYTEEGMLEAARDAFISALQAAPQEPASHLNLGMVLVRMERWEESKVPLGTYRAMAPDDVRGHALLGRAELETGNVEAARAIWLEGAAAEGVTAEDAVALLQEYTRSYLGDDREASYDELGELARTLESRPRLLDTEGGEDLRDTIEFAYMERARLAVEDDRPEDALENWAEVRAMGSDKDAAWLQPARRLLDAGKVSAGRELVDEARTRRPDSAMVHFLDGLVKEQENDLRGAASAYRKAVAIDPEFSGVNANLGEVLASLGDTQGASEALGRAVELGEGGAAASYNMGVVLSKKGRFREAIPHLERAVELDPAHKDAYRALGTAYRKTDDFTGAADIYQRLIDRFGPDARDLYQLGFAQAKIDEHRDAAENFQMVAALEPGNWRAHYSLGNALREIERYDEAIEAYRKALELEPGNYAISYNLALSMQLAGRLEDALLQYEKTLAIRETRAVYVNMAICYTNLGDEDTANEYYAIAEELRTSGR